MRTKLSRPVPHGRPGCARRCSSPAWRRLLIAVGVGQSWVVSLSILNLCLISAIMALGLNMQWGYAGLLNVGVMGFAALGGLAGVLISQSPVAEAWSAGGAGLGIALCGGGGCRTADRTAAPLRAEKTAAHGGDGGRPRRRLSSSPASSSTRRWTRSSASTAPRPAIWAAPACRSSSLGLSAVCSPPARRGSSARVALGLRSGLLRHRHARHRRDRHHRHQERGLAQPRREERHGPRPAGALRNRPAAERLVPRSGPLARRGPRSRAPASS